jgi:hypothetical protein
MIVRANTYVFTNSLFDLAHSLEAGALTES